MTLYHRRLGALGPWRKEPTLQYWLPLQDFIFATLTSISWRRLCADFTDIQVYFIDDNSAVIIILLGVVLNMFLFY